MKWCVYVCPLYVFEAAIGLSLFAVSCIPHSATVDMDNLLPKCCEKHNMADEELAKSFLFTQAEDMNIHLVYLFFYKGTG